jgi:preprotein translocase subunit YajC
MKKIVVKIGDEVKLFNGTEGIINEIDKSVYQLTLSGDYIIWFHIRDIKQLNGEIIDNDMLVF